MPIPEKDALITVIIPTFRRPKLLKRAIESVLAQTYPHLQLCIYDDASGDETAESVAAYVKSDKRVFFHEHVKNIGSNPNFLYGLERVETPFFIFLADDDFFLPTFFEKAMEHFARYPQAGMVIGGLIVADEKLQPVSFDFYAWAEKECYAPKELISHLARGAPLPYLAATLFRREVKEEIGLLNPELIWHDVDYLLRAFKVFSVAFCRAPSAIFFQHASNLSRSISLQQFFELRLRCHDLIKGFFSAEEERELLTEIEKNTRNALLSFSMLKFAWGNFKEALSGIAILQERYSLNTKERMLRALAHFFSKHSLGFSLLSSIFYLRKKVVRRLNSYKLRSRWSHKKERNIA